MAIGVEIGGDDVDILQLGLGKWQGVDEPETLLTIIEINGDIT